MSTPSSAVSSAIDRTLAIDSVDLFPTLVWQSRLTSLAPLFCGWIEAVQAARVASPEQAGRSNRMGWNSAEKAILNRPVFAELHRALNACCRYVFGQMGQQGRSFTLESSINIHDRGGFNFLHQHDGTLLSGVFYLQTPDGSGRLTFRDPRPGVLHSPFKGSGANTHNEIQLVPEAGLVALFPHWLDHYVEPHDSDIPRIAISFNAL
jgi:uncharacterized protein (TIGR02466 family)